MDIQKIKSFNVSSLISKVIILFLLLPTFNAVAQNPGDRAQKFKGTWWSGVHPTLLDDRMLEFRTLDGFGVGFTNGASLSAEHFAPVPLLSNLPGAASVFPPNNDTFVLDQLKKVTNAGFMVQAYTNSETFLGDNQDHLVEFSESWKNWCDTNPQAQAFINSQSYHRKAGFPDRHYMFCYAEFILKYYSQQYGQYIDIWVFDDGHSMVEQGDNATNGNTNDQRIYEAFANAARAGNDEIAVAFNNGRSRANFPSYPFAHAVRSDDFTFGHAFGGNNNHAEKVNGNQFNLNYQHIERMTETDGHVHEGGVFDWDDNIVGHFFSKLSTTAWNFGPQQAWEQDDFNEWHEEALSAGGMMTWSGSYNRPVTFYYDYVYDLLKATDDYLFARGISVNAENNGQNNSNNQNNSTPTTSPTITPANGTVVHITKSNAQSFAIDGNNGAENEQSIYLWSANEDNQNQQWIEIDRGNGFYSYQKMNSNHCIDGGQGGALRQDVYLWECRDNNQNQHWQKVSMAGGTFKLIKRNAPGFALNGGSNGADAQNINLFDSANTSQNLQWIITPQDRVVHITKGNAAGFALDGAAGAANEQDVYLWAANPNNRNQQWMEISRGNGYFSYQKVDTGHCIDGGDQGASNGQNVYLWQCNANNQNQHWLKVVQANGTYRLVKRNDSNFAINGGNNGSNAQEVGLWNNPTNANLTWNITPIQ